MTEPVGVEPLKAGCTVAEMTVPVLLAGSGEAGEEVRQ